MEIKFAFRKPAFPIICNIDNNLIAAKSKISFIKYLQSCQLTKEHYDIIDSSSEGWTFHTDLMTISPFSFKKHWTKKEIIQLYNQRNGVKNKYSEKSLSNKRFNKMFCEIVELILKGE